MKFVYTHMGLGDQIVCNGLIRRLHERFGPLALFVKPHNYASIRFMLRDLKDVICIGTDDNGARQWLAAIPEGRRVIIGHEYRDHSVPFDESFYRCAAVPFSERWDSFRVDIEPDRQIAVSPPYYFVHEDSRYKIVRLDRGTTWFNPSIIMDPNIFNWLRAAREADQIHVIESAFAFMLDSFPELHDKPKFIHRYARQYPSNERPTYRNNWTILE